MDDAKWPTILEHCSFDYMRARAMEKDDPLLKGGGATFYNKGTNGRWRDVLTAEDNARFHAGAAQNLTPDAAKWLETGDLPD